MKRSIAWKANAVNERKESIKLDTTEVGDPVGIVQEIYVWPYEQMIYAQPRIRLWRRPTKLFEIWRYKQIT